MKSFSLLALAFAWMAAGTLTPVFAAQPEDAGSPAERHHRAVRFHLQRRLDEASREYALTLAQEPSRPLSEVEKATVRRFAPRLMTHPHEPFPLKDAAAILHPTERVIAYHLFWEDDIDFPDDNDPCDHEVVWIRFSADGRTLERIWTYFHDRILEGGEGAIADARGNHQRPAIFVQWGKHGSMPLGWENLELTRTSGDLDLLPEGLRKNSLLEYNRNTWIRLTTEGRRSGNNAFARREGWPDKFTGTFENFTDLSRGVDPILLLDQRRLVAVSRWNSAVIDLEFLAYNFRPKTEWPEPAISGNPAAQNALRVFASAPAEEVFRLPAKATFDQAMPRYPNVWFHLDASLAGSHEAAVRLVADELRGPLRLVEHQKRGEGCDFEVRLEHLQPWEAPQHRALQHAHAFHMRYYHSALARNGLERVTLPTLTGPREFWRFAASAHYEVEHTNPNHADVEICPHCGRTGDYAQMTGNLVEKVHDPLGLELLLEGTIRGKAIRFEDDQPRPFGGINQLANRYALERLVFDADRGDRNTLRVGILVISPFPRN